MNLHAADLVAINCAAEGFFFKCIANESDVVFFSGAIQHRDLKLAGVSYEDDYQGNAVAGTITKGFIDVRFHEKYSDAKITKMFLDVLDNSEMEAISGYCVRYQGRVLIPAGANKSLNPTSDP